MQQHGANPEVDARRMAHHLHTMTSRTDPYTVLAERTVAQRQNGEPNNAIMHIYWWKKIDREDIFFPQRDAADEMATRKMGYI